MSLAAAWLVADTTIGRRSVAAGAAPGGASTPKSVKSFELVSEIVPRLVPVAVWFAPKSASYEVAVLSSCA
jgi:hypothetical protein